MYSKNLFISKAAIGIAFLCSAIGNAGTFPDYGYTPPTDWALPTFQLSQQYPHKLTSSSTPPWQKIDFHVEPEKYMRAVLEYCFEGNVEGDFVAQNNTVRPWYHVPWLHWGANGREFVRGLTRERTSNPYELSPKQTQQYRNFAIGFYNEVGAYTIGKVWRDAQKPNIKKVEFPEHSVTFKLLFTTGTESEIPYLEGAPEWIADIDRASTSQHILGTKVRLLQVDIAVKDKRSAKGGWIFGTFHYDSSIQNQNPWLRLRALTLMWGDDPELTPAKFQAGARPTESWVNQDSPLVKYRNNPPAGTTPPRTLGWAGRGNGPVDNSVSSCLSCHSTVQIPAISPLVPPKNLSDEEKLRWFRNIKKNEAFDTGSHSLDFSLQLGVGIQNLAEFEKVVPNLGGVSAAATKKGMKSLGVQPNEKPEYRFSRDPD